jgi:hypothetical protein
MMTGIVLRNGKHEDLGLGINRRKLQEGFVRILVRSLYEYANPADLEKCTAMDITSRPTKAIEKYHNDPFHRHFIDSCVSSLIRHTEECLEGEDA